MRTEEDIAAFIADQPRMLACLRTVESLHLPDGWIGAGFVRNAVWDALHGFDAGSSPNTDIDVVFFDAADVSEARDRTIEDRLLAALPGESWSVKNQARMHIRNGEPPYRNTADAISRWPETATAVAARWQKGHVEILAPHGIGDLIGLIVRPTPAFHNRRDEVAQRVASKDWPARWPRLRIEGI